MSAVLISILCPLAFEIVHTPPERAYNSEPVEIYASTSEEPVSAYLSIGETAVPIKKEKRILLATIPAKFVNPPYVKYRIIVKTHDNKTIRSPEYKIQVIEVTSDEEQVISDKIELLTPEPYESISDRKPEIVLAFNNKVEISDITILLDEIDITRRCEITSYSMYYKPDNELAIGKHSLEVVIEKETSSYTFSISSNKYANGYISTGLRYASCDDSDAQDYLPYETGLRMPLDIYASGTFYLPFYFWMYYEETTNFNLELETPIVKISIGDVHPTGSLLSLYVTSPKGIQINTNSLPLNIELLAGKIENEDITLCIDTLIDTFILVDTTFIDTIIDTLVDTLVDSTVSGNYTRYIFGGSARAELWNAKLAVSCFYGFDDSAGSEIDSNLLKTALIESPVRNNFITGEIEYPVLKNLSLGAEYSISKTRNIPSYISTDTTSQDTTGSAYFLFIKFENDWVDAKLAYNKIGRSYYTVGNPYLEAGKGGFLGEFSSLCSNIYYNGTYEVYQIYDTLEYNLYTSLNYTLGKFTPYITHSLVGSSTNFTLGNRFGFGRGNLSLSYGIGSSSNSFRGDCNYEVLENKLSIKGGYGRSVSLDSLGTQMTLTQNSDLEIELMRLISPLSNYCDGISIEYKGFFNDDYLSQEYTYDENVFTLRLKKRF